MLTTFVKPLLKLSYTDFPRPGVEGKSTVMQIFTCQLRWKSLVSEGLIGFYWKFLLKPKYLEAWPISSEAEHGSHQM